VGIVIIPALEVLFSPDRMAVTLVFFDWTYFHTILFGRKLNNRVSITESRRWHPDSTESNALEEKPNSGNW